MTKSSVAATAQDLVSALADAVAQFCAPRADVFVVLPELLVRHFGAGRAELWLADEAGGSLRLRNAAGAAGMPMGESIPPIEIRENAALVAMSVDAQEFGAHSGLTHVSTFPLSVAGRPIGLCACYNAGEASGERLRWWRLYVNIAAVVVAGAYTARSSLKQITQLSLLFEATRLLNSTLDLAELLELILKIARTEAKADRGTVFLVDRKTRELWSIVASGLDHQEIRMPFGRGVAGRVAETGETVNVADAYALDYFEPSFDRRFNYRTQSLLCMPIRHRSGEVVGVLQLLNRTTGGQFTPEDADFLSKLSAHIAMALENARLHREMLEKQRIERDLALARNIQRGLLPDAPPVVPGFEIAVQNQMCYDVGGDYYDFLNLGPHTLLLVIADVEGKGVASALVMSNLQATLRALVMHLHSLEVLALSVNDMICADTRRQKFMSMFLGLIDTRANKLHYINAGHCPPVLVDGETGRSKLLDKGGTVIGMFPDAVYTRGSEKLNRGDILICCTDGILEASNKQEEEYGYERMAECIARQRTRPAQTIVETVLHEVNQFAVGGQNVDDKVLMVVKVTADPANASGKMPAWRP